MSLKTYDPEQDSLAIAGSLIDADEMTIEFDEDQNTFSTGVHGESTRTRNLNRVALWTIVLPQTHGHNDVLSALALADAPFVSSYIDLEGTTLAMAAESVVIKRPPIGRVKEAGQNTWLIRGKTEVFVGGNT